MERKEEDGQGGQWFSGYSDLLFFHLQRSCLVRDDCGPRLVCWLPAHCWPGLYSSTGENQKRLQPQHSRPVCTHTPGAFSGRCSVSLLLPLSSRTQAIDLSFEKKAVWIQRTPQTCSPLFPSKVTLISKGPSSAQTPLGREGYWCLSSTPAHTLLLGY